MDSRINICNIYIFGSEKELKMSINIEGMVSKEDQENAASLKRVF